MADAPRVRVTMLPSPSGAERAQPTSGGPRAARDGRCLLRLREVASGYDHADRHRKAAQGRVSAPPPRAANKARHDRERGRSARRIRTGNAEAPLPLQAIEAAYAYTYHTAARTSRKNAARTSACGTPVLQPPKRCAVDPLAPRVLTGVVSLSPAACIQTGCGTRALRAGRELPTPVVLDPACPTRSPVTDQRRAQRPDATGFDSSRRLGRVDGEVVSGTEARGHRFWF